MIRMTNKIPALLALAFTLSGCVPGLVADAASVGTSGKSLTDHALDAATGKDCRVVEGMAREDRDVCERRGSKPTRRAYKGLAAGGGGKG